MFRGLVAVTLSSVLLFGCGARDSGRERAPVRSYITHTVKYSGETLGAIAAWYTGSAGNWSRILDANPGLKVNRIRMGDEILIPYEIVRKEQPMPQRFVSGKAKTEAPTAELRSATDDRTAGELQPAGDAAAASGTEDTEDGPAAAESMPVDSGAGEADSIFSAVAKAVAEKQAELDKKKGAAASSELDQASSLDRGEGAPSAAPHKVATDHGSSGTAADSVEVAAEGVPPAEPPSLVGDAEEVRRANVAAAEEARKAALAEVEQALLEAQNSAGTAAGN